MDTCYGTDCAKQLAMSLKMEEKDTVRFHDMLLRRCDELGIEAVECKIWSESYFSWAIGKLVASPWAVLLALNEMFYPCFESESHKALFRWLCGYIEENQGRLYPKTP